MKSGFERLKGVFPLASMAFQEDGAVDYQGFEQIVRFTCGTGANGVGLWGMMAEYYKLSDAEREKLADRFFQITGEYQISTLVSVTDWCTELAVKRAKEYQEKGADFLMLLPPFYYHPTMEAVLQHIQQVTEAVEIPVVVQYAPQSTGMFFEEETIISLADRYTNLAFKIEHNPQRAFIEKFLTLKPTLKVMSGYAGLDMPELLSTGVRGVMPGCSFTEIYVEIYRLYTNGESSAADALYRKLEPYLKSWMSSVEKLIAVDKQILQRRNVLPNSLCRHPAYQLETCDAEQIGCFMAEFQNLCPRF